MSSENTDPWRFRRRFLLATCLFCAATIWLCILLKVDAAVATSAITMAFGILGTSVSSYVFGAAWETISKKG